MQPEPKSYVIKKKYELPSMTFPYRIKTRLNMLSCPRRQFIEEPIMPALTPFGVRKAALAGPVNYKIHEAALPYLRILLSLKRNFKHKFDEQRLERVNRKIEAANATVYSKLANCVINLKSQQDPNLSSFASRKKKAWSESDWRKHTEYLLNLSKPKRVHQPELFERGEPVPLEQLLPRIEKLVRVPETKIYKRLSQDTWYRNPTKVASGALKYTISDRVKKLSEPRKYEEQ